MWCFTLWCHKLTILNQTVVPYIAMRFSAVRYTVMVILPCTSAIFVKHCAGSSTVGLALWSVCVVISSSVLSSVCISLARNLPLRTWNKLRRAFDTWYNIGMCTSVALLQNVWHNMKYAFSFFRTHHSCRSFGHAYPNRGLGCGHTSPLSVPHLVRMHWFVNKEVCSVNSPNLGHMGSSQFTRFDYMNLE